MNLTNDAIIDQYSQHPADLVRTFKRLMAMLRLFRNEGTADPDIVFTLLRDEYGDTVDEIELWRDFRTLCDLNLIGVDETV